MYVDMVWKLPPLTAGGHCLALTAAAAGRLVTATQLSGSWDQGAAVASRSNCNDLAAGLARPSSEKHPQADAFCIRLDSLN